ncbi:MAG: endonuclease domain-containing protein [Ignavibacteriae bacterium]|nr:MAG: endonuclease domain-containing protein [Ignavibacteriota bacterium]
MPLTQPDLLALAREMRRNATQAERIMWGRLRNRKLGGFKFYRQIVIQGRILDFLCKDAMLIVEIDGEVHAEAGQRIRDQQRDAGFALLGYRTLRIYNADVILKTDAVCERVLDVVYEQIEHIR